mmetsp:Transcript_24480/g.76288  ORF Transcript_24480/g.76288 Transcript_24480/m.76288 type:complete len:208 (+) Transcript_24480:350-973(+)
MSLARWRASSPDVLCADALAHQPGQPQVLDPRRQGRPQKPEWGAGPWCRESWTPALAHGCARHSVPRRWLRSPASHHQNRWRHPDHRAPLALASPRGWVGPAASTRRRERQRRVPTRLLSALELQLPRCPRASSREAVPRPVTLAARGTRRRARRRCRHGRHAHRFQPPRPRPRPRRHRDQCHTAAMLVGMRSAPRRPERPRLLEAG